MSRDAWAAASAAAFEALALGPAEHALAQDVDLDVLAVPWRALTERLRGWLDEPGSGHHDPAARLVAFLRALDAGELERLGISSRDWVIARLAEARNGSGRLDPVEALAAARVARDAEATRAQPTTYSRLRRVDVGRMLREPPPPVPWVVEGLLARGALSLFPGREGVGKSLFAMALVVGVVTGEPAGPFETCPGRVMVVDAENGEGELHRRLQALGLAAGAEERLAIYLTESGDLLNAPEELGAVVADERPDLLVVDSLRSNWRGRENDSDEIGPALDRLRNMAREAGCAVALIHHAGKLGGEYRGSTAIGAACEIVVGIGRHADDPEPDRFVLTCAKMRPAPRWEPRWIRLAVEMGVIVQLEAAEPFIADDVPPPPKAPAREAIAPQIARVLAGSDRPLQLAEIARAIGRDPKDRTVRRVLDEMAARGAARRLDDGRWRGWQPHEPLKGAATPATPPPHATDPQGQGDGEGGSLPATRTPLFPRPADPDDPLAEGAHRGA